MTADPTPPEDGSATLSIPEAARYLGIGRNVAYAAVQTGQIPSLCIGKRKVIPRAALERLLSGEPRLAR